MGDCTNVCLVKYNCKSKGKWDNLVVVGLSSLDPPDIFMGICWESLGWG